MKKVILICIPFIVLVVLFLGSNISFRSLLQRISEIQFRFPSVAELKATITQLQNSLDFTDLAWYEVALRIFNGIMYTGQILANVVKLVITFLLDMVYNLSQVIFVFGGTLVLN